VQLALEQLVPQVLMVPQVFREVQAPRAQLGPLVWTEPQEVQEPLELLAQLVPQVFKAPLVLLEAQGQMEQLGPLVRREVLAPQALQVLPEPLVFEEISILLQLLIH
jgi:hypothetical protein